MGAVYYIGHSNTQKVEDYFITNECEGIYNYKTQYKALCQNGVVLINDYFIIDFSSNQTILYTDIEGMEKDEKKVYIHHASQAWVLDFEKEKDSQAFFNILEKRVQY